METPIDGTEIESSDSITKKTDYCIIGPYRFVIPYHFDFVCSVKQRWSGKNIIDIFSKEFPARSREYYENAFGEGRLRVEGPIVVTAETGLHAGARMRHLVHRHEPPVPNTTLDIIEVNENHVVANKPPGMPVHVGGQYRKNTVLGILEAEHSELMPLSPAHRLDKPVSGVLIFSRNRDAADMLRKAINHGETKKLYIARVQGKVGGKDGIKRIACPLAWDATSGRALPGMADDATSNYTDAGFDVANSDTGCKDERLVDSVQNESSVPRKKKAKMCKADRRESAKLAAEAAVHASEKGLDTIYRRSETWVKVLAVAPDEKTTLVECQPITGRTHQIRAHLAYIGHPIANDGTYGGTCNSYFSPRELGKQQMRGPRMLPDEKKNDAPCSSSSSCFLDTDFISAKTDMPHKEFTLNNDEFSGQTPLECIKAPESSHDYMCPHCPYFVPKDYPVDLKPLWLHAKEYHVCGHVYTAALPMWAQPDFTVRD
eukprot:jgi/Picsp_1/412/NSC_00410-R1_pseudouridine synthase